VEAEAEVDDAKDKEKEQRRDERKLDGCCTTL
jgi:hypothetical protein